MARVPVNVLGQTVSGSEVIGRIASGLLGVAVFALGACTPPVQEDKRMWWTDWTPQAAVCDHGDMAPAVLKRQRLADEALRQAFLAKTANPVAEARKAVTAGDFRLAAAMTTKDDQAEPYGVQCRVVTGLDPWMTRIIAFEGDEADGDPSALAELARAASVEDFGARYNRAVLASPAYPYRDVCRPIGQGKGAIAQERRSRADEPFVLFEPGPISRPASLADAARRGNAQALDRMLASQQEDVNKPDLFGMTPLAWAVAYRESAAANELLRSEASPAGASCQSLQDANSPIQIARTMEWRAQILRMRHLLSPEDFERLAEQPEMTDREELLFRIALIELAKRNEKALSKQASTMQRVTIDVDDEGAAKSCDLEPGTPLKEFDREMCSLAVSILRFTPARNTFGTAVPGEFTIAVRTMGK